MMITAAMVIIMTTTTTAAAAPSIETTIGRRSRNKASTIASIPPPPPPPYSGGFSCTRLRPGYDMSILKYWLMGDHGCCAIVISALLAVFLMIGGRMVMVMWFLKRFGDGWW